MSREASEAFCLELAAAVPELIPVLEEHVTFNDELLPHVFFGDVCRYVERELRNGQSEKLPSLLATLEDGLRGGDPDVDNVISVSFVEWFLDEPGFLNRLRQDSGPRMKALIDLMSNWRSDAL